jgi:hypothetical protein
MRNSMHSVNPLNPEEGNVVARNSSWLKERSVKWMAQVFANGKVPRLACRPFGGTHEVERPGFLEITLKYAHGL